MNRLKHVRSNSYPAIIWLGLLLWVFLVESMIMIALERMALPRAEF